jgi:SulP family sulfate permease
LLTVFFDMVIAITTGILLASILFMKESAALTRLVDVTDNRDFVRKLLPANWRAYKINGPLFFAAADRLLGEISAKTQDLDGVILHMRYSAYLDAGGLAAIEKLQAHCENNDIQLYFSAWQFQPLKTLLRARGESKSPLDASFSTLDEAINTILKKEQRSPA